MILKIQYSDGLILEEDTGMAKNIKTSESITENIFRNFYGVNAFIEKSAIPSEYGFISKSGTD